MEKVLNAGTSIGEHLSDANVGHELTDTTPSTFISLTGNYYDNL